MTLPRTLAWMLRIQSASALVRCADCCARACASRSACARDFAFALRLRLHRLHFPLLARARLGLLRILLLLLLELLAIQRLPVARGSSSLLPCRAARRPSCVPPPASPSVQCPRRACPASRLSVSGGGTTAGLGGARSRRRQAGVAAGSAWRRAAVAAWVGDRFARRCLCRRRVQLDRDRFRFPVLPMDGKDQHRDKRQLHEYGQRQCEPLAGDLSRRARPFGFLHGSVSFPAGGRAGRPSSRHCAAAGRARRARPRSARSCRRRRPPVGPASPAWRRCAPPGRRA